MDDLFQLCRKKLGFGLMRLPKDGNGKISVEETAAMADRFIENGFTYFDTAYVYPGSEEVFREAIGSRHPRDSYTLASKMAAWFLTDSFTPQMMFDEQLRRTGAEYFDFYLLHNLKAEHLPYNERFNTYDFCIRMKKEGKIRHLGFSFHDTPELLDRILTEHPEMEFVQLQINYLDWTSSRVQSEGIYRVARKHSKPIIIMEPVKGGLLSNLSPSLTEPFGTVSPASYALRFAATLEGVLTVLSGMSSMQQMEENMTTFSPLKPLDEKEEAAIAEVKARIEALQEIQCTSCRYCVPGCPKQIDIPEIFKLLNEEAVLSDKTKPRSDYRKMITDGKAGASECIRCGKCEKACPQRLPIRDLLSGAEGRLLAE